MKRKIVLLVTGTVVASLLHNGCSRPALLTKSDDFRQRVESVKMISIERPVVNIWLGRDFGNGVRLPEEESEAMGRLTASASTQLQNRGLQVVAVDETDTARTALKLRIRMDMFKRSGVSNATETLIKLVIAAGTAGWWIPAKDTSGRIRISATLWDESTDGIEEKASSVLWSNTVYHWSGTVAGQVRFNLDKLVAELFKGFER